MNYELQKLSKETTENRKNVWAMTVCLLVPSLIAFDVAKSQVILESIRISTNASDGLLQLVLAGFMLPLALVLVPAGRLGDLGHRRSLLILGLAGITAASLMSALAPDAAWLVAFRTVQGLSAGVALPQAVGMIQELFHGQVRAKVFGLLGVGLGTASAIGPVAGAALLLADINIGWRLVLLLNVPFGILGVLLARRVLPKGATRPSRLYNLDVLGTILLGTGVGLILAPLVLDSFRLNDVRTLIFLAGGSCAIALFVFWERYYEARGYLPLVDFKLLRIGSFRRAVLIALLYFVSVGALFLVVLVYIQFGLQTSPMMIGYIALPFALAHALGAWAASKFSIRRFRILQIVGALLPTLSFTAGAMAVISVDARHHYPVLLAVMAIGGFGAGIVVTVNQTLLLVDMPTENGGLAASIGQLSQRLGNAIGITVGLGVFLAGGGAGSAETGFKQAIFFGVIFMGLVATFAIVDLVRSRAVAEPNGSVGKS